MEFSLKENSNGSPDEEFECMLVQSDINIPGLEALNEGKSILFGADQLNLLFCTIVEALDGDEN